MAARRLCVRHGLPFTTAYHTRFPQYLHARVRLPLRSWVYGFLRRFHGAASARDGRRRSRSTATSPAHRPDQHRDAGRAASTSTSSSPSRRWPHREPASGRSSSTSAASRSRRTSRPSSSSTCPAPSGSPATARTCAELQARYPGRALRRRASRARSSRACTRARTCSCSRAAPTPSAWCCSRRWPAARRWRPIPVAGAARRRRQQRRSGARRRPALRRAARAAHRPRALPPSCRALLLGGRCAPVPRPATADRLRAGRRSPAARLSCARPMAVRWDGGVVGN